jgi:hypothetical protein
MNKRPLSVTIVGCVYIVTGAIGFAYHFHDLLLRPFPPDSLWIALVRLLAIVAGAFLLCGRNWSRWLALAWIAFHVILSAFHPFFQLAVHCLFLAVIAWSLLRPAAARYFRAAPAPPG